MDIAEVEVADTTESEMQPNTTPWFPNSSMGPPPGYVPLEVPTYLQVIIITMYTLIIVLAVGGNLIVCYTILRVRRMRTVINFFIISLSISDILMAIFCIPFTFVANLVLNYWPFGDVLCPIVTFLQAAVVFLSSFILVAISIDRYVAIIYPLRQKLSKKQAGIIIAIVWILAFSIPLPTAIYSRIHKYVDYPTAPEFCEEIWSDPTARYVYSICILLLQYFIPLVVLAFSYGQIVVVMCIKKPPGEAVSTRDRIMAESKRKITKMMIIVVIIYAVCWLPLHIINIIGAVNPGIYDEAHMNIVWMMFHWLAMSNCMYNPFVYCWMNSKFRHGFLRVLSCLSFGLLKSPDESDPQRLMQRQDTYMTMVSSPGYKSKFCTRSVFTNSTECCPLNGQKIDLQLTQK